jgi:hypothetical protein
VGGGLKAEDLRFKVWQGHSAIGVSVSPYVPAAQEGWMYVFYSWTFGGIAYWELWLERLNLESSPLPTIVEQTKESEDGTPVVAIPFRYYEVTSPSGS